MSLIFFMENRLPNVLLFPQETDQVEYLIPERSSLAHHLQANDSAFLDFLHSLLQINPKRRPSAGQALQHRWLSVSYSWLPENLTEGPFLLVTDECRGYLLFVRIFSRASLLGSCIFVCMSVNIYFAHKCMQVKSSPSVHILRMFLCFLWKFFVSEMQTVSQKKDVVLMFSIVFKVRSFSFLVPKIVSFISFSPWGFHVVVFTHTAAIRYLFLFKCEPESSGPIIDDLLCSKLMYQPR